MFNSYTQWVSVITVSETVDRRSFIKSGSLGLAALGIATAASGSLPKAAADDDNDDNDRWRGRKRFSIDIACDGSTFEYTAPTGRLPIPGNPWESLPASGPGGPFIVQGIIYEPGTLAPSPSSTGILISNVVETSPEFPDEVIGRWYCRGWFINGGMPPSLTGGSGAFVVTTQIYDIPGEVTLVIPETGPPVVTPVPSGFSIEDPGGKTLVSDGIELFDLATPWRRAVTGGTGPYRKARGEVTQEGIGANATGLFNFTFDFRL